MDKEQINAYVVAFHKDVKENGWSGQSKEYQRGVLETLSHINGMLVGTYSVVTFPRHKHDPFGETEHHGVARLGQCACGVDMVSYLLPEGSQGNWEEWRPTSLGDPCLSCGGYNTPSCCGDATK